MLTKTQIAFVVLAAAGFVAIASTHFTNPASFVRIVPPFVPWPLAMVYISGVAEIAGGVGLLIPRTRRLAAWCLVALLIAVFPANIYAAVARISMSDAPASGPANWVRLPFQFVFIWWVQRSTQVSEVWPEPGRRRS